MLVGFPGCGKSTWTNSLINLQRINDPNLDQIRVISADNVIELIAKEHKLTYNDVYSNISYAFCERLMVELAKKAAANPKVETIIWDQTNLKKKSRIKRLELFDPTIFTREVIVFQIPSNHQELLNNRKEKIIPVEVMQRMKETMEEVTYDEGYDRLFVTDGNLTDFELKDK